MRKYSKRRRLYGLHRHLCISIALLWASLAVAKPTGSIFPLEEIRPGLTGQGWSVFQGNKPEAFAVEVVGVWRDVAPDTSYILARLSGQGLEESGVIAGMSGSPVYIEDRLVGAVAFAWPFSNEALAGITPIELMRSLGADGGDPPATATASTIDLSSIARAEFSPDLLTNALQNLVPRQASQHGSLGGILWSASGLGHETRSHLSRAVGEVTSAGRAAAEAQTLEAGDAVSAVLIGGDLRLAATGTVTERMEEGVLAFGHPFLGLGSIQVPMASAEVVAVVSSQASSFKIANVGSTLGSFEVDRSPGIRGRLGVEAPTIPLTVEIEGTVAKRFDLSLAKLPQLTPALGAIATLGSLEATTQLAGEQAIDLTMEYDLGELGDLVLEQNFDGEAAPTQAALYFLAVAGYLLQNPFEAVELEEIAVRVRQHTEPRVATLVDLHSDRTVVEAGETVSLVAELAPYRGPRRREVLRLQIPEDVPSGPYSILVGDGASMDVVELLVEKRAPINLAQALELLRSFRARTVLAAIGVRFAPGMVVAGEPLPDLPGSVRSLWQGRGAPAEPLQMAIVQRDAREIDRPIAGVARVDFQVVRKGVAGNMPEGESGMVVSPEDGS